MGSKSSVHSTIRGRAGERNNQIMTFSIAIVVLASLSQTNGHGGMFYPMPWWNKLGDGLILNEYPDSNWDLSFEGRDLEVPNNLCDDSTPGGCSKCLTKSCWSYWFTNQTYIPGEPTLPDDMYDVTDEAELQKVKEGKHPWTSPGTAPTFGNGCGANGGNPSGCQCQEDGSNYCYGNDNRGAGACCSKSAGSCGAFLGGQNTTDYAVDGYFDDAAVTVWNRGTNAEVIWKVAQSETAGHHKGGYAYRLCKVGGGGIAAVTEECFQQGHLNFFGPDNWLLYLTNGDNDIEATFEQPLVTTTVGTAPEGSEWATYHVPNHNDFPYAFGIMDLVQVPESLEPGDYVLSFRWDCQKTPQVWE